MDLVISPEELPAFNVFALWYEIIASLSENMEPLDRERLRDLKLRAESMASEASDAHAVQKDRMLVTT